MRPAVLLLSIVLAFPAPSFAARQAIESSTYVESEALEGGAAAVVLPVSRPEATLDRPFSRIAVGGGLSSLGVRVEVAIGRNRWTNMRTTANLLNYSRNNISTGGFNIDARLKMASAGVSLDIYPFPRHGLRLSPGILLRNSNSAEGNFTAKRGTCFTFNGHTYVSSAGNPVHGYAIVGAHSKNPAFTMTTGWGNVLPPKGGHFSFPFEVGVAFVGPPALNVSLTSGQMCDVRLRNCLDVVTDPQVLTSLQTQVEKYRHDLAPLKTYPIVSFGVAYSFCVRRRGGY
jgi:hypothetical protein